MFCSSIFFAKAESCAAVASSAGLRARLCAGAELKHASIKQKTRTDKRRNFIWEMLASAAFSGKHGAICLCRRFLVNSEDAGAYAKTDRTGSMGTQTGRRWRTTVPGHITAGHEGSAQENAE